MNDYDRKLYRDSWGRGLQCEMRIHGNVEVSKGDLIFYDRVDGLRDRGVSIKDHYGYPFNKVSGTTLTLASNITLAAENFVGVAASYSDSGVTESIAVHMKGLFKYSLKISRYPKIGQCIIPTGSGVTLFNQRVAVQDSISDAIGKVADSGKFKSSVEMFILPNVFYAGSFVTP